MQLSLIFWIWLCGAVIYYGLLVWRCDLFSWMRRRHEYLIFVALTLIWPVTVVAIMARVVLHLLVRRRKSPADEAVEALEFHQEASNAILARALETPAIFSIHRDIVLNARAISVLDGRAISHLDGRTVCSLIGESGSRVELGAVVRRRLVGPFDVRLVSLESENLEPADVWQVVVTRGIERGRRPDLRFGERAGARGGHPVRRGGYRDRPDLRLRPRGPSLRRTSRATMQDSKILGEMPRCWD
jgi:hypothetical protein